MTQTRWFYSKDQERHGPVDREKLVELLLTADIPMTTLVWRHGLDAWVPANQVPDLAIELPPPLPASRPPEEEPPPLPSPPAVAEPVVAEPVVAEPLVAEPPEEPEPVLAV